jgi:aminoglycoside 2'-N-acetyltransferase I
MALTIETRQTDSIDQATRDAVVSVCLAATPEAVGFRELFSLLPPDGLHLLGYDDDRLVSHAVVTTRWLQPAGLPLLRTAYVDAVATLPDCQGRGFGSAVMRELASVITGYAIGCLETGKVGFHERLGWERWRGPLAGRSADGLIPTPDQDGVMVLRLPHTPALDLEALLTIERQPARIW